MTGLSTNPISALRECGTATPSLTQVEQRLSRSFNALNNFSENRFCDGGTTSDTNSRNTLSLSAPCRFRLMARSVNVSATRSGSTTPVALAGKRSVFIDGASSHRHLFAPHQILQPRLPHGLLRLMEQ